MTNTLTMNILPEDQQFIFSLLDRALQAETHPDIEVMIIVTQFGQKDKSPLDLSQCFELPKIKTISIHSACNLNAEEYNTHLLWAREGLREVIGNRGKLFTCLSISEAANFQTNLDIRAIDITADLRRVAKYPS